MDKIIFQQTKAGGWEKDLGALVHLRRGEVAVACAGVRVLQPTFEWKSFSENGCKRLRFVPHTSTLNTASRRSC